MNQNNPTSPDDIPLSHLNRQQLYERVRKSSKDAVVLQEMQRLGFWPDAEEQPSAAETLIKREAELIETLNSLNTQWRKIQDPEKALHEMRKQRMVKAKERREITKQKHAQQRFERATAWHRRRQQEVSYLGDTVSAGLNEAINDDQRLQQHALPVPDSSLALAQQMGITLAELRFLAYERRVARVNHYRRFEIAKKSGGTRIISAPMPRLKRAQYWILDNILGKIPIHDCAHGFVSGRSIVSNAGPHIGQKIVVNLDLKDFFPSISYPRIKGVFRSLGYSEQLASVLGLLCTETPTTRVLVDHEEFYIANGMRHLPQGAPTSPMLTNILCRSLDRRLDGLARQMGFCYTRYADDMTFSADESAHRKVSKLLWRAKQIVVEEGYVVHPDKQRVMRSSHQQQVTGLVVNRKLSIDRATMKRFRATLFQVEKDGPDGKQWNGNSNVIHALEGYARFIAMVDVPRAQPYLLRIRDLKAKFSLQGSVVRPAVRCSSEQFRQTSAKGQAPWQEWWQPAGRPEPVIELTPAQVKEQAKRAKMESAVPIPKQQSSERKSDKTRRTADTVRPEKRVTLLLLFFQAILCQICATLTSKPLILVGGFAYILVMFMFTILRRPIAAKTSWRFLFMTMLVFWLVSGLLR